MKKASVQYLLVFLIVSHVAARAERQHAHSADKSPASCVRVQDGAFHSVALDREMKYRVLLPCHYNRVSGRFPVLYLLHGLYGDFLNWDTHTRLQRYAAKYEFIVVTPDADDSWYTNSATNVKDRFEDYIAKDLVAEIDTKFRTLRSRHSRAIAGLSMGGYGAVKIALRFRDEFAFAGSLSGALNAPLDLGDRQPDFREQLLTVFGPAGSAVRADNDVFAMLRNTVAKDFPYFYLACGSGDSFLPVNREFVAQLSSESMRYEYHETDGGHAWDYWDRSVQGLLRAVASAISTGSDDRNE